MLRLEDIEVASKNRPKMDIADRAKQFMPFAALTGLPEALDKVLEEKSRVNSGFDNDLGAWRETDRRQYGRREEICSTD